MNGFDIVSTHVTFGAWPYVLVALVVPLALLALATGGLSRRRAERRFGLSARGSAARRVLAATALLIALALVAAAAARPQWGEEEVQQAARHRPGGALDVSLSMAVQDVSAGRLELAKDEVLALFDSLRGDRVGLGHVRGGCAVAIPPHHGHRHIGADGAYHHRNDRVGDGSSPATAINAAPSAFVNESSTTKVLLRSPMASRSAARRWIRCGDTAGKGRRHLRHCRRCGHGGGRAHPGAQSPARGHDVPRSIVVLAMRRCPAG